MKNAIRLVCQEAIEVARLGRLEDGFPVHFHDHYLLGCLLSGRRRFTFGSQSKDIGPMELVALNPGQAHACQPLTDKPQEWLCLHIPLRAMRVLAGADAPAVPIFRSAIFKNEQLAREFIHHAEKLEHQGSENACCHLESFLAQIVEKRPGKELETSPAMAGMRSLCERLLQNPGLPIQLGEMAALARMDKFRLTRQFGRLLGITPHRYLQSLRLCLGRDLLKKGDTISASALEAGFFDQSHFSKCFRKNFGFSPGAYRQAWARRKNMD